MAFLDNTGLTYFWGKIKSYLSTNYVDKTTYANTTATLSSHVASTSNPHKVTASQVGAYTKAQTDSAISTAVKEAVSSAYKVKGSVATYADLPTTGQTEGDVYNVVAAYENYPAGTNWVWVAETTSGSTTTAAHWDALGGAVDLSGYYTNTQVDTKLASKVDKVSGKGLSTNDYTTTEKNKLAGIATGAQVNVIEKIYEYGNNTTPLTINSASKSVTLPDYAKSSAITTIKNDVSANAKNITALQSSVSDMSTQVDENTDSITTIKESIEDINSDLDGKEETANKVTAFADTENDTHYPSALLVKAELAKKANDDEAEKVANKSPFLSSQSKHNTYPTSQIVWEKLEERAPKASPALTGTPTAPTAASGTSTTQIATTAFVQAAVADVTGAVTAITNAEIDTICAA